MCTPIEVMHIKLKLMRGYITKILLLLTICTLSNCEVEYDADPFNGYTLPRKTEYGNDWLYYNLMDNKYLNPKTSGDSLNNNKGPIIEGDHFNRNDWDIAFNRYNIRTNSGVSGSSKGGAFDMGLVAYDDIISISQLPESLVFVTDSVYNITISQQEWNSKYYKEKNEPWFDPNSGPKQMSSTANTLLANALRFSGPPPEYIPSNHVYILRTADGENYFKLMIISWYDQYKLIGERGGKISFRCDKLEH